MSDSHGSRRSYLVGVAAGLAAAIAGCTDSPGSTEDGAPADTTQSTATTTETATSGGTATTPGETTGDAELDFREANVVGVAVEREGDRYRFDVTLHHDDDGEDGYANWWQVETVDGERLARRELSHAHGTREFTRSETMGLPDGVTTVVVRGHDQTHGYGGQAAVVDVARDTTDFVRQGSERQAVAQSD